jgi:hypothetical protein
MELNLPDVSHFKNMENLKPLLKEAKSFPGHHLVFACAPYTNIMKFSP